jgi:hypothetical protein
VKSAPPSGSVVWGHVNAAPICECQSSFGLLWRKPALMQCVAVALVLDFAGSGESLFAVKSDCIQLHI